MNPLSTLRPRRLARPHLLALAAALALPATVGAQATNTWQCAGGGWLTSNVCWTLGAAPNNTQNVVVNGSGSDGTNLMLLTAIGNTGTTIAAKQITLGTDRTAPTPSATAQLYLSGMTLNAELVRVGAGNNSKAVLNVTNGSTLSSSVTLGNWNPTIQPNDPALGFGTFTLQGNARVVGNVTVNNGQFDMNGGSVTNVVVGAWPTRTTAVANIAGTVTDTIDVGTSTAVVNIGASAASGLTASVFQLRASGGTVNLVERSDLGSNVFLQGGLVTFKTGSAVSQSNLNSNGFTTAGSTAVVFEQGSQFSGTTLKLSSASNIATLAGTQITLAREFVNSGTLNVVSGTSSLTSSSQQNTGTISIDGGARLNLLTGELTNTGTVRLESGGLLNARAVKNEIGASIQLTGGQFVHTGLTNAGTVSGTGRVSAVGAAVAFVQQSNGFVFASGGDLTIDGRFDGSAGGTIGTQNGRLFFYGDTLFKPGQVITQSGTGRLIAFRDKVEIGNATQRGSLEAVIANLALQSTSNLFLDFAGVTDHDYLSTGGALVVEGGKLTLSTVGSFRAGLGSFYNVFRQTSGIFGTFSSIDATAFAMAPGARLDFSNLYTTGTVAVVPEPATWLSLGAGLLLIGARARRWRQEA